MGDVPGILFGNRFNSTAQELNSYHGVSTSAVGVSALAHDLFHFDNTSQVPEQLSGYVGSSMEAQTTWYAKLLQAWKEAKLAPETPEQASRLVIQTLEMADVEGLLKFYGLPIPIDRVKVQAVVIVPPPLAEGVKFVLQTLRVDENSICDGDCLTVFVDAADPREAPNVPNIVQVSLSQRLKASASKDYTMEKSYYDNHEAILAKRYRVRLRGIDAPKKNMYYGKDAKDELTQLVQGKSLTVHVYGVDQFGRLVGDVYCNGLFVQEAMLKKGCAWYGVAYDQRPEFTKWELEARAAGVGLWALPNPGKPGECRNKNPEMPWDWRIPIISKRTC